MFNSEFKAELGDLIKVSYGYLVASSINRKDLTATFSWFGNEEAAKECQNSINTSARIKQKS